MRLRRQTGGSLTPEMARAALAADAGRPMTERTAAYLRGQRVEAYLATQRIVIWPGCIYDLTDDDDRARARVWLTTLLEEVGE